MSLSVTVVHWEAFLLVLVRTASMLMVAPAFGAKPIPMQVRVGLAAFLAMLLTPLQEVDGPLLTDAVSIALLVSKEVLVGLLMGFAGTLVFSAVHMATQLMGVQIGYSFSNTVDPMAGQSTGFLDTFYNMLAMVLFLGLGGHHALILALANSYQVVPIGGFAPSGAMAQSLVLLAAAAFGVAIKLAMPIVGTMLLTDCAMALVVRSIPQMNIFMVGLPIKMVLGIVMMIALIPMMVAGIGNVSRNVATATVGVLR